MGEVYRACDTRPDRLVAIKILPEAFTADAERVARFQREAEVLASLNQQNIAISHGLEQADGAHALVMELVEGEDLSQRIARGAIPVDEALPTARQIAEAEAAQREFTAGVGRNVGNRGHIRAKRRIDARRERDSDRLRARAEVRTGDGGEPFPAVMAGAGQRPGRPSRVRGPVLARFGDYLTGLLRSP